MLSRSIILDKLKLCTNSTLVHDSFERMYDQYTSGESGYMNWEDIQSIPPIEFNDLKSWEQVDNSLVSKVSFLKLNGGLGTSMGCVGPKSLIPLDRKHTFLNMSVAQLRSQRNYYQEEIPFILMNSFKTEIQTKQSLPSDLTHVYHFNQNKFPRIRADNYEPFTHLDNPEQEWAPPGHGDLYVALDESGLLDKLLSMGKDYLFVSNIDNLGPQLDLRILTRMHRYKLDFIMEVTRKTLSDVKGGTPVLYKKRLALLERAQVSPDKLNSFEDLHMFPVFNTNNLWLHLPTLKELLLKNVFNLPLIVNRKKLFKTDIVQLETAMGAALECFDSSEVVIVDRDRFLPVKTTKDLLVLQSDVIDKNWESGLFKFSEGCFSYPEISLHHSFDNMDGYSQRVKRIPSLKDVSSFTHLEDKDIV